MCPVPCPPTQVSGAGEAAHVCPRCVPPFSGADSAGTGLWAIVFPGGCGGSLSSEPLQGLPCFGSRRTAGLPKASSVFAFFLKKK